MNIDKVFEALEEIGNIDLGDNPYKKFDTNKLKNVYNAEFTILYNAIAELKAIKEAEPSEALKELEQNIKDRIILAEDRQLKLCAIIKQALLKAQGQEKENELTLKDLVSKHIINPNSVVDVYEQDKNNPHYSNRIFKGMAWKMEKGEIGNRKLKHIFSAVAETISESDRICIEVE